jgi:hypothetical protein
MTQQNGSSGKMLSVTTEGKEAQPRVLQVYTIPDAVRAAVV